MVHNEMTTTYGTSHVAAVNVVYNTSKLDPLLAKYDKSKGQLEDITDDYIGKLRRGQEIKKRKQVGWQGWLQMWYAMGRTSQFSRSGLQWTFWLAMVW
jgi:GTP1/Obg family GTP-binding protein